MSFGKEFTLITESVFKRDDYDQALQFTDLQNALQRTLGIVASCVAMFCCLSALYCLSAMDPKLLVFRHRLIVFLIMFDLLKSVVLLIFPSRVLRHPDAYGDQGFCQVIGFFCTISIEGADFAILGFAIHTCLIIFKPNLSMKIPDSDRVEGGLYRYRYYVYGLAVLIPIALASFPLIGVGYKSYVSWCYLPQSPVWYRLAFNWAPRFCIIIIILSVYGFIYFHVLREFRRLGGVFSTMYRHKQSGSLNPSQPSFFSSLKFFFESVRYHIFPKRVLQGESNQMSSAEFLPDSNIELIALETVPSTIDTHQRTLGDAEPVASDSLHAANLEMFRARQKVIEKQMKSIFVYPVAYILIWIFPFILQCTQIHYELKNGPIVWLNYIASFLHPFYGFVDAMVFFYRERPLKHTVMKNYAKQYDKHLKNINFWSSSCAETDSTLLGSNGINVPHVDLLQYSRWRRLLCKLRFPLMQLPNQRNVARLHAVYAACSRDTSQHAGPSFESSTAKPVMDFTNSQGKHDFSNILFDNASDGDVRSFSRYNMSFPNDLRGPATTANRISNHARSDGRRNSANSTLNRSALSRHYSVANDGAIPEEWEYSAATERIRGSTAMGRKSLQPASVGNESTASAGSSEEELDLLEFLLK